jgi:hypothetical protein
MLKKFLQTSALLTISCVVFTSDAVEGVKVRMEGLQGDEVNQHSPT